MAPNRHRRVSEELQKSNKELKDYVETLEETIDIASHKGRKLSEATNKIRCLYWHLRVMLCLIYFHCTLGRF